MKKNHHFHALKSIQLIIIFSFLVLLSLPSFASRIIVGCTKGAVDTHDTRYPQQSIGKVPNRIVNYELVFQKGNYAVRISSRFEFISLIYKKVNGKYTWAGMPTKVKFQNDKSGNAFFYYDFYANHLRGAYNNYWLLQIKPVPQAQNISHMIRVVTKPLSCPEPTLVKPPCPPGYKLNPMGGTFGQADCIKK
jgi:hypothetical protein